MIRLLLILAPFTLLAAPWRDFLESSMYTHMLVEFPLLAAGGLAWAGTRKLRAYACCDRGGITTLVLASAIGAFWMIPAALDLALIVPAVAAAKYVTLWLLGAALASGWGRMAGEIRIFLVGNAAWMLATAGLLIHGSEQRLCVNYLVDDQVVTGAGLVVAAMAMLVGPLCPMLARCAHRPPGSSHAS